MTDQNISKKFSDVVPDEERPLIEFPALMMGLGIAVSFAVAATVLFLPLEIAIGLFVGLMSILLITMFPYAGLLVFVVVNYLQPARFFAALQPLHITRILSLMTLFSWIVHAMILNKSPFVRNRQNIFILGFALCALGSSFQHPDYSLVFFLESFKVFVLFFLILNLLTRERHVLLFVWTLIFAGGAIAAIGIYQYIHHIGLYYADEGILRVTGPLDDPNDFAVHMIILIPLVVYLLQRRITAGLKAVLLMLGGMMVLAVIFTFSRGGAIGFLFSLGLLGLRFIARQTRGRTQGVLYFLLFCVLLGALVPLVPGEYWDRLTSGDIWQDEAVISRLHAWRTGLEMMKQKPFIGVGLNTFQYFYHPYAPVGINARRRIVAHNMYISVGAENGIPALFFFLGILLTAFIQLQRAKRKFLAKGNASMANLSELLVISLSGYCVCSFFLSIEWVQALWILIGLSAAVFAISEQNAGQDAGVRAYGNGG